MKIAYGINVQDMNNKYVNLSEQVNEVMTEGTKFFLVNFIPARTSCHFRCAHAWGLNLCSKMGPGVVSRGGVPEKSQRVEKNTITNAGLPLCSLSSDPCMSHFSSLPVYSCE